MSHFKVRKPGDTALTTTVQLLWLSGHLEAILKDVEPEIQKIAVSARGLYA